MKRLMILLVIAMMFVSCREKNETSDRDIMLRYVTCYPSADGKICACCNSAIDSVCAVGKASSFFVAECKYAEEFYTVVRNK